MVPIFERYTERARQVVVLAQDEARHLKHNYIGTEHLVLGLLREESGLAARVLESLDVSVEEVRVKVARIVPPGGEIITGQIPFTPRAKRVLELSLREALLLGHNYIGTEHILLGLVRENEGVAATILRECGADAVKVRDEIIRMLSGPVRSAEAVSISNNPLVELVEAALGISGLLRLSTDQPPPQRAMLLSPARALRQQAEQMEKEDKAIKRFRAAIQRFDNVEST